MEGQVVTVTFRAVSVGTVPPLARTRRTVFITLGMYAPCPAFYVFHDGCRHRRGIGGGSKFGGSG